MTKLLTDWVCIGRSGSTADGREIKGSDLVAMAANYDVETYTAVVNFEHLYGNLGSVRELKTVTRDDKKVELHARLRVNKYYLQANAEERGIFFSMEIKQNFADTRKPYLVGLAATDSPASLGTTEVHFSKQKSDGYLLSEPVEFKFADSENKVSLKQKFCNTLMALFNSEDDDFSENINQNKEQNMTKDEMLSTIGEALKPLTEAVEKLSQSKPQEPATQEPKTETAEFSQLKEEFGKLQESFNALDEQYNKLNSKLDDALSSKEPKSQATEGAVDDGGEKLTALV